MTQRTADVLLVVALGVWGVVMALLIAQAVQP